ncbi:MAG: response regulator transcription factor [Kangiellaceae bacterium]|nr:response regulator transcription factor [Kangiellaceae bacterium]
MNKIVIADDHPLFRNALKHALQASLSCRIFIEADSISELETILISNSDADLLLLDLHMPGANGFVGLTHIVKRNPQLPIVMISANDSIEIAANAKQYGALGFVTKSASIETISNTIEKVISGELCFPTGSLESKAIDQMEQISLVRKIAELTPKQLEVFNLLAGGLLNKQIAFEQQVTEATVKAHVTAIMRKLEVYNRTQVVLIANKVHIKQDFNS